MPRSARPADALGAMYFVAAVLMALAAIAVVVLMFLPRDFGNRGGDVWVPGSTPGYVGPGGDAPEPAPEQRAREEELHMH